MRIENPLKMLCCCLAVIVLMIVGGTHTGCSGTQLAEQEKQSKSLPKFEPITVIPNPFPAIVKPDTVSAEEANDKLKPSELVLGVKVNGESRAYPINMLTGPIREIINDELGGEAIAATW